MFLGFFLKKIGNYLNAVRSLQEKFQPYAELPKMKALSQQFEAIVEDLKKQILKDFKSLVPVPSETENLGKSSKSKEAEPPQKSANEKPISDSILADACFCVDAIGDAFRSEVVNVYVQAVVSHYRLLYSTGKGRDFELESMRKRYKWLKKAIQIHEEKYASIIPTGWCIIQELVVEFCLQTREDVEKMLKGNKDMLDGTTLYSALMATISFEREMHTRFHEITEIELEQRFKRECKEEGLDYDIFNAEEPEKKHPDVFNTKEGVKKFYLFQRKKKSWEKKKQQQLAQSNQVFF